MKKLLFTHDQAERVRSGRLQTTIQVYEEDNFRVNDSVQLIDKVAPGKEDAWTVIGDARVNQVAEMRLGDVDPAQLRDDLGLVGPKSSDDIYTTLRNMYGPKVDHNTIIKRISFTLNEDNNNNVAKETTPGVVEVKLYSDGGSRGNPGPSACGFVILTMDDKVIVQKGKYLGVTTNNQAEYQGLRLGLEEALRLGAQEVHAYMDSMLVVNQMKGIFNIKNRDLWPINDSITELVARFKHVTFTHVPRELNKLADKQVNDALDAQVKSVKS